MDSLAAALSRLTGAANQSKEDFDLFQQGAEQNQVAAENLLSEGRTSGKVPGTLCSPGLGPEEHGSAVIPAPYKGVGTRAGK